MLRNSEAVKRQRNGVASQVPPLPPVPPLERKMPFALTLPTDCGFLLITTYSISHYHLFHISLPLIPYLITTYSICDFGINGNEFIPMTAIGIPLPPYSHKGFAFSQDYLFHISLPLIPPLLKHQCQWCGTSTACLLASCAPCPCRCTP